MQIVLEVGLVLLGLVPLVVGKRSARTRFLLTLFVLVTASRLCLFGNPFAWAIYSKFLRVDDVDYRPSDVIRIEERKYQFGLPQNHSKYLAVGSSQIGCIFVNATARAAGIRNFSLAGMGPLDFVLYSDYICDCSPEYVILYLSEFDLCRAPQVTLLKTGPSQGFGWFRLLAALQPYWSLVILAHPV